MNSSNKKVERNIKGKEKIKLINKSLRIKKKIRRKIIL